MPYQSIDFSSHLISPEVAKILAEKSYFGPRGLFKFPHENSDPKERINVMEKYGVNIQVLSQTTPVLLGWNAREAAKICQMSNFAIFDLCTKYPDRFVGLAIVSLLDMKTAMAELKRSIEDYGFRGVVISTNQKNKALDSPQFNRFYEKVTEYDVPIFLHPTNWEGYSLVDMNGGYRLMHIFGWPFDTTQAVSRLILGGVLDKFPLKIVTHHLGGMLPYFRRRFELIVKSCLNSLIEKPLQEYFSNIYGDTAVDGEKSAINCGYEFFGSERMLFGTDYPMGPEKGDDFVRTNLENILSMHISEEEKRKILFDNAKRLLKL